MITPELVVQKSLAHLNGGITEAELVQWAEDAFVLLSESNVHVVNEQAVMETLMYIGAGDQPGFPLSWSVLSQFLERLGMKVRVTAEAA